jgi:limonene-1,2-epoxide hydrolase
MNPSRARHAVVILALGAAACAGPNKESADPILDHDAALAATVPAALGAPAPGSPEEKAAVERFEAFIADLSTGAIKEQIRNVYAPTLYFNDTLKTIRDVDALEKYFLSSDDAMSAYGLKVEQTISTPEGVFVRWRMDVMFRRMRKGDVQSSIGISHIRFDKDGRVVYHQDYWDSGTNLYEKIPVLGGMIRWIKSRL